MKDYQKGEIYVWCRDKSDRTPKFILKQTYNRGRGLSYHERRRVGFSDPDTTDSINSDYDSRSWARPKVRNPAKNNSSREQDEDATSSFPSSFLESGEEEENIRKTRKK